MLPQEKRLVTTETAEDLNVKAAKRLQGWGGQRTGIKIPQWEAGALRITGLRRAPEEIGQWPQAESIPVSVGKPQSQRHNLAKEMDLSSSSYSTEGWKKGFDLMTRVLHIKVYIFKAVTSVKYLVSHTSPASPIMSVQVLEGV